MTQSEILRANFTISLAAKQAIAKVREEYDAQSPDDPAAVLMVGWGIAIPETGPQVENVVISFYPQSMLNDVAHGIQQVSGIDLIYFTIEPYHQRFIGKVLDYTNDQAFFLRQP